MDKRLLYGSVLLGGIALTVYATHSYDKRQEQEHFKVMEFSNDDGSNEKYIIHDDKVYGELETCVQEPPEFMYDI